MSPIFQVEPTLAQAENSPGADGLFDQLGKPVGEVVGPLVQRLSFEVLSTLIVILFGVMLYLLVSRMLARIDRRSHLDRSLIVTLRIVIRWLFTILILAAILQVWDVLDQFWAALTALVTLVAIGFFAVWSVLSNVLCSMILLGTRPFRIGQRISLPPDEVLTGTVQEITLLHTVLKTPAGDTLKIPNNVFFQRSLMIHGPATAAAEPAPPRPEAKDQGVDPDTENQ